MDISEMIAKMGGLKPMASELGVSEQEAATGADALAPAILGGFERQSAPADADAGGNGVLASIFGSKDVSRAVAQDASTRTGLNTATLKKMLPLVAMMVASYMAKHRGAANERPGLSGGNALDAILQRMAPR